MRRIAMTIGLAAATLAVAACTKKDDVPQNSNISAAPEAAPSDTRTGEFLTDAIAGDLGEIRLGQLALKKASARNVRDFAQTLVTDHGKSRDQAEQLANSLGATIPPNPRPDASAEYDKLQSLAGRDFDREFVSFMVNDHQQAINAYQAEAGTTDPAQVTAFAKQTLPTLKTHLQMAESLATGLNGKGS